MLLCPEKTTCLIRIAPPEKDHLFLSGHIRRTGRKLKRIPHNARNPPQNYLKCLTILHNGFRETNGSFLPENMPRLFLKASKMRGVLLISKGNGNNTKEGMKPDHIFEDVKVAVRADTLCVSGSCQVMEKEHTLLFYDTMFPETLLHHRRDTHAPQRQDFFSYNARHD
jgi:hypothetical protein